MITLRLCLLLRLRNAPMSENPDPDPVEVRLMIRDDDEIFGEVEEDAGSGA